MNILSNIASLLKRNGCNNLVKRHGSEFEVNGAGVGVGEIKVGVDKFSNHIVEFVTATDLAINMDNTQYLLCEEIARIKNNESLKDECKRIRLQIIIAVSQLQNILASMKEAQGGGGLTSGKQLKEWIKYMGALHKNAISLLGRKHKTGIGKGAMKLAQIMKYQGIDEREMQEVINEV